MLYEKRTYYWANLHGPFIFHHHHHHRHHRRHLIIFIVLLMLLLLLLLLLTILLLLFLQSINQSVKQAIKTPSCIATYH